MTAGRPSIFSTLSASRRARTLSTMDLGFQRSVAVWSNDRDRVTYERPEGHTFSLYLEGGVGTRRVDGHSVTGWPGALSFMPHGSRSEWEITAPFTFVHLYVPAEELRRVFAETFERDARLIEVPEITFAETPHVAAALQSLAAASRDGDPLAAEAAMVEVMVQFLGDIRHGGRRPDAITGGLAPHLRRRVINYVETHLGEPIRLRDLAETAGLSEAHFQRAFLASHGVSPHVWITHRRVARAKSLLRGRDPIAAVALACGFSSQSHLTRAFKAATGVTPGAYRRLA
jgi:AraC family transcriptional regulator